MISASSYRSKFVSCLVQLTWLSCLLVGPLSLPVFANAQVASSSAPASAQQPKPAAEPAAEEDETAPYKTSPSVQAIGKMMHMSPHAASAAFEYFNFAILAGVVLFYLAKALPKAFRARQEKIDQQLVEARTATEEANARLQIVEARLGKLDQEIEEFRKRAEQDAATDEQRIKQSIEDERVKIVGAAEQEIAAAALAAERGLRRFAAELAMDRAMGRLHLTEQDDRALIGEFAGRLEATDLNERRN